MRHEKIIRRDDGSRIKIEIDLTIDHFARHDRFWRNTVWKCKKNKRTWINCGQSTIVVYPAQGASIPETGDAGFYRFPKKGTIENATEAEIIDTAMELWNKIKPTDFTRDFL